MTKAELLKKIDGLEKDNAELCDAIASYRDDEGALQIRVESQQRSIEALETRNKDLTGQLDRANQNLKAERELRLQEVSNLREKVFVRRDVEYMSRVQLVTCLQEMCAEAKRKGFIEAEGAMMKHLSNDRETDEQILRNIVETYTNRLNSVLESKKTAEQLSVAPSHSSLPGRVRAVKDRDRLLNGLWTVYKSPDSGNAYTLHRAGVDGQRHYTCSCPAWQFSKEPIELRTCKHLKAVLGDAFEMNRLSQALQLHKRNNEPEYCICGRRMSFCSDPGQARLNQLAHHTPTRKP